MMVSAEGTRTLVDWFVGGGGGGYYDERYPDVYEPTVNHGLRARNG